MRFFSFIAALVALPGTATALSGEATFYGGNTQGGMCSFSTYTIPNSIYGTALSDSNWAGSEACGACVKVSYGGKSLTAMVSSHFRPYVFNQLTSSRLSTNAPAAAPTTLTFSQAPLPISQLPAKASSVSLGTTSIVPSPAHFKYT